MKSARTVGHTGEPARASSWGGPEAWSELRRLADDARVRTGFETSAIEVLRADGLLELVAFTGPAVQLADLGGSFSLGHVRRVLAEGTPYGSFVFLAEEDMDDDLREAIREYGYVPELPEAGGPDRWRPLDMLVAHLVDRSGRTRALLHLDEPRSGRRPSPEELRALARDLELTLQAVLATVDREEMARRARLDETARAVVRAASLRLSESQLLARLGGELRSGFRARTTAVWLHEASVVPADAPADPTPVPERLRDAVLAAARRGWTTRTVVVVDRDRAWGDDELDRHHRADLRQHLLQADAGELLLVPVGAGHESMGVLVVLRDGREDRWTTGESTVALGVGHDVGRALLSTRAHEREQLLIEQLQQLDLDRRRLLDNVSHELKNPLGVMAGHVELLEGSPDLPLSAGPSLRALGRSVARLGSLVDDLLLLSRHGELQGPAAQEPVDLAVLVAEVVEDAALGAERSGVTVRTVLPDVAPHVLGEAEALRQLLANLLSNAVKYSRDDGTVTLELSTSAAEVVLACVDDGIGISAEDQRELFTEFFRSTNPAALQRPGTGLGLPIVARIAARHGGRVDVDSELGVGTTFWVRLPRGASSA